LPCLSGGCALAEIVTAPASIIKCYRGVITSLTTTTPVFFLIFQHYEFNMESRHLLNLSIQNALDCISENFVGACPQIPLESRAVGTSDGRYRPHIVTRLYLSAPSITKSSVRPDYLIKHTGHEVKENDH